MTLRLILLGLGIWIVVGFLVGSLVGRLLAHRAEDYPPPDELVCSHGYYGGCHICTWSDTGTSGVLVKEDTAETGWT